MPSDREKPRNDSAPRSWLRSGRVTRNRNGRHGTRIIALASRHSVTDYSSDLVAWWAARIILRAPSHQLGPDELRSTGVIWIPLGSFNVIEFLIPLSTKAH
jgi:uncharacterized membrane protein